MKSIYNIAVIFAAAAILYACEPEIGFGLDGDKIEIDADGGTRSVRITSAGEWVASSNKPWITVSPTNGKGSEICQIIVDTSVVFASEEATRSGEVLIRNSEWEDRTITVTQKNYPYTLTMAEPEVTIPNYKEKSDRWFEVEVKTNADFNVEYDYTVDIEAGIQGDWLEVEEHKLELDRGARPRNVKLRFKWDINSAPADRLAKVELAPVGADGKPLDKGIFSQFDILNVTQTASEKIEENTRRGDSTALLGIARSLGVSTVWDPSTKMSNWSGVTLWETDDERNGRVKSARFFMFSTDDGIPFEVQYLTAAEELSFFSNTNEFLREDIEVGPYIVNTKLSGLKRLTISAYGMEDLPAEFAALSNLEYLDISSNNFRKIPDVLTPENFPKLHALIMNNNVRNSVYDLSNVTVGSGAFAAKYSGLFDENLKAENQVEGSAPESGFPVRFLKWENLDTLVLGVNYLTGSLPSDEYLASIGLPVYTKEEIEAADTLWSGLEGKPKVFTNMDRLTFNLNRLSGELPDWIRFHPKLDLWQPFILLFTQEGKDINGNSAGFSNAPANFDYYYKLDGYENKKLSPYRKDDENEKN